MIDELERLVKLWQMGALTDDEFAQGKQRLLAPPPAAEPQEQPAAAESRDSGPESETVAEAPAPLAAEDDLQFDDLSAMLDDGLDDLPPLDDDFVAETPIAGPAPEALEPALAEPQRDDLDILFDELPDLDDDILAEAEPGAAEPAADDEPLFDDLDSLLDDLPPLDADVLAEPEEPLVAALADAPAEPAIADDLKFDDISAMLDDVLDDLPELDDEDVLVEADVPAAVARDDVLLDDGLDALQPLEEAPAASADLSIDDLNAMLDEAPAGDVLADILAEAQAQDTLQIDDLDAMLSDNLADLPPLDDEKPADPEPMPAPAPVLDETPEELGTFTELPTADDLLFDDLNVMLDEGMADLPVLDDISTDAAPAEIVDAAADADLLFDDLNVMLDDSPADLPPLDEKPVELASAQVVDGAADDDLLFDDLNIMLDEGTADLPTVEAISPREAPSGKAALVEHAELLADDLDMVLEEAHPEALPSADADVADATPVEAATAPLPAVTPAEAEAKAPRARRKIAIPPALAAKLAKLPPPVRMGLGGAGLFLGAMVIGVVLALATAPHAENAETAAAEEHGGEHADTGAHAEKTSAHGEAQAPDTPAAERPAAEKPVTATQTAYEPEEVMRQCAAINAMSEDYGTALAEHRKVPIQSLTVITGTGYVRADPHKPTHRSCVVAFEMKTGPRQCKVDAVVRFPDGDVGAHLGEKRRIICEGDAGFNT